MGLPFFVVLNCRGVESSWGLIIVGLSCCGIGFFVGLHYCGVGFLWGCILAELNH